MGIANGGNGVEVNGRATPGSSHPPRHQDVPCMLLLAGSLRKLDRLRNQLVDARLDRLWSNTQNRTDCGVPERGR